MIDSLLRITCNSSDGALANSNEIDQGWGLATARESVPFRSIGLASALSVLRPTIRLHLTSRLGYASR